MEPTIPQPSLAAIPRNNGSRGSATVPADDLSRFCLEADALDSQRAMVWTNSVCLAFLVIGLFGIQPLAVEIARRTTPVPEAVPTVIEPLITAPLPVSAEAGSAEVAPATAPATEPGVPAVAVAVDSPAVVFAVPTIGNLLVPLSKAQPPPAQPMQPAVALPAPKIETVSLTGVGGSRPPPRYPPESLRNGERGKVILLIEVDALGRVTSVTVRQSSGHPRLDRAAVEQVQQHWVFAPGEQARQYECPMIFQFQ